jgi:hypothetical protein
MAQAPHLVSFVGIEDWWVQQMTLGPFTVHA